MGTLFYKHKIVKTQNIDELYKNGGDDKYIIPIFEGSSLTEKVLKIENDRNFINLINILEDTEIDECLDFHYNNFEKKKNLFLIHAETLIENEAELLNSNKDKKKIVLKWIEEKNEKLNEPEQQSKHNEPKRTDYYKTLFNQKEITLFAYFLREKKIILENTSSILLAECFGKLTDYSKDQIYKDLKSKKNCFDISDNRTHYQNILSELKKLTKYIENEVKTKRPDLIIKE